MSQDIVSDALNKMMNAKKAGKSSLEVSRHSRLLLSLLALAKLKGYVKNYKLDSSSNILTIELGNLHGCSAIKPRFLIQADEIGKYVSRYLPSAGLGMLIVSTNQGLMTHLTAQEKNIGGSLIAYMF